MEHDLINARLGNYRIQRLLGRGGFAEVYLGEHIYLKTVAAIKLLDTEQQNIQNFVQEARLLASLRHPHIVSILEFDIYNDRPFLVMEYLPHGTLRQRFPPGTRLPMETILACIEQMAEALDYLHGRDLAHGDVKPENMLLDEQDQLHLSDFGIAILANKQREQALVGTIHYMAPEQLQHQLQPASDQYALGVIAYEWLCGEPPFTGSYIEIATQHALTPPDPLHERVPNLSMDVESVILRALAKEPGQRFSSAGAFANALANVYYGSLSTERREPLTPTQLAPTIIPSQVENQRLYPLTQSELPPNLSTNPKISRRSLLITGSIGIATLGLAGTGGLLWWKDAQHTQKAGSRQVRSTVTAQLAPPQGSVYFIYHKQIGHVGSLAWSPDGTRIASSDISAFSASNPSYGKEHQIHVWDALTGNHSVIYQSRAVPADIGVLWSPPLAWSPNGKYIASGDATNNASLYVWESATGKLVASFERNYGTISQIYWYETNQILAVCGTSGYIIHWHPFASTDDIQSRRFSLGNIDKFDPCSVSPDGKYIIASNTTVTIVYRLADGQQISIDKTVGGYTSLFDPYFWSPDSRRCITQHARYPPEAWDTLTSQVLAHSKQGNASVISWSPDSQKVASYGADGAIFIWNATSGSTLYKHAPHVPKVALVSSIAWSPNGRMIASGDDQGGIEVWRAV